MQPPGSGPYPAVVIIEVFADIWCPFTHVGLHLLDEQRRRNGRDDVGLLVRAWPLELINGAPMDAVAVGQKAEALREQVAPDLFAHVDVEHFPTSTLDALALEARAQRFGVGERASFALRDALFEHGHDVSDPDVLARLATELGTGTPDDDDRAAVLAAWEEGRARGVVGSPHFFHGTSDVFCPSLDIARTGDHAWSITLDTSRLQAFLDECLAAE